MSQLPAAGSSGPLGLDDKGLWACVSCGLCLGQCPTWRVTGEEGLSPRGRIAAMRAVESGAPADAGFDRLMETCVQCRACETACPSSVPFGHLMEQVRSVISPRSVPGWQRLGYRLLGSHRALLALSSAGGLLQRVGLLPPSVSRRFALPKLPVLRRPLRATGDDVWLFTGCVMDAWMRPVHEAVISVLGAAGAGVALPGPGAACCGALHVHAGLREEARALARKVVAAFPGEAPVLVDSAGCGAELKEYGRLLGTEEGARFAARVLDVHEWLAPRVGSLPEPRGPRPVVAVQDPCHLRHVQRCEQAVRQVLGRYCELVELDDDGRCCGAGGAYSALHPELAGAIRAQKLAAIDRSGAKLVASANPGCALWLGAAGLEVRHPLEIVAVAAGLTRQGAPASISGVRPANSEALYG